MLARLACQLPHPPTPTPHCPPSLLHTQGETIEEAVRRETREEAGVLVGAVDIVGSQPWPVGRGGSCELMIGCIAQALPGGTDICIDPVEMDDVRWVSLAGECMAAWVNSCCKQLPRSSGQGRRTGRMSSADLGGRHTSHLLTHSLTCPPTHPSSPLGPPTPLPFRPPACTPADVAEAVRQSSAADNPYVGGSGASRSPRIDYFVPPPLAIAHHLLRCWSEHADPWFGTAAATAAAAGPGTEPGETPPPSNL